MPHPWLAMALMLAPPTVMTAPPALAELPPAELVVDGRRRTPAEVRTEAGTLVHDLGLWHDRPLARWVDPVCPAVSGVAPAVAARVVAPARCRANLRIAFVADGAAFLRLVRARAPRSLAEVPAADRAALLDAPRPVRWWYGIATTGALGEKLEGEAPPAGWGSNGGADFPVGAEGAFSSYRSGLVATDTVGVIRSASVVVDVTQATGRRLDAVADYAALVALAELRPRDPPPAGSVLELFGAEPAVDGLGWCDRAVLGALYALPLARFAAQQRAQLVAGTADALRR